MLGAKQFAATWRTGRRRRSTASSSASRRRARSARSPRARCGCASSLTGVMAHGAMPQHGRNPVPVAAGAGRCARRGRAPLRRPARRPRAPRPALPDADRAAGRRRGQVNVIPATRRRCASTSARFRASTTRRSSSRCAARRRRSRDRRVSVYGSRCSTTGRRWTRRSTTRWCVALAAAHEAVTGEPARYGGVPGATDGTILTRDAGLATVVYGPGGKWIAHQADEFVEVADIAHGRQRVRRGRAALPDGGVAVSGLRPGRRTASSTSAGLRVGHAPARRRRLADRARPWCSRRPAARSAASTCAAAARAPARPTCSTRATSWSGCTRWCSPAAAPSVWRLPTASMRRLADAGIGLPGRRRPARSCRSCRPRWSSTSAAAATSGPRPDASFGERAYDDAAGAAGRGGPRRAASAPAPAPWSAASRAVSARRARVLADGTTVAALAVVNAVGSAVDPRTGELLGARHVLRRRARLAARLRRPASSRPRRRPLPGGRGRARRWPRRWGSSRPTGR